MRRNQHKQYFMCAEMPPVVFVGPDSHEVHGLWIHSMTLVYIFRDPLPFTETSKEEEEGTKRDLCAVHFPDTCCRLGGSD